MITANISLSPGVLIAYGSAFDASLHKHHVIQIIWPTGKSSCKLAGHEIHSAVIINSQVQHQLTMEAGWVVLIEPQSDIGQKISERLKNNNDEQSAPNLDYLMLPEAIAIQAKAPSQLVESTRHFTSDLAPLLTALCLDSAATSQSAVLSDQRIQALLDDLDSCFDSDCLKPSHWSAAEVASKLALSESRFLHLFREQMAIAWRPYLLWRRMICAISAIIQGHSATDAAYIAGVTDSSHLSRTFRAHFGMSIRDSLLLFKPA
jgi:AraC-like DNA-binding protein